MIIKKYQQILLAVFIITLFGLNYISAANIDKNQSNGLRGRLLLQVEDKGRIWYVNPENDKRYEVTFANALTLFQDLALGISNKDLDQIPVSEDNSTTAIGNRLKGKLLLQVEDHGRIWYIDLNGKRHEVMWANLMDLFTSLSLGITNIDLNKIPINISITSSNVQNIVPSETKTTIQQINNQEIPVNDQEIPVNNQEIPVNDQEILVNDQETPEHIRWKYCNGYGYDSIVKDCINNKIVLKYHKKRIGLLYVSNDNGTYNPNWRESLSPLLPKMKNTLLQLTNGKADYSFEILGHYKTNQFCWNPAKLGVFWKLDYIKINKDTNETVVSHDEPIVNMVIPGSSFRSRGSSNDYLKEKSVIEGGTNYLIKNTSYTTTTCTSCSYTPMQDVTESYQQLFPTEGFTKVLERSLRIKCDQGLDFMDLSKLDDLRKDAARELNFQLSDYDYVVVIFGRFGQILPNESVENKNYRCGVVSGVIGGLSEMVVAENSLLTNGLVDCREYNNTSSWITSFYDAEGWKIIPHELLHNLGAVDIYDTGLTLGIKSGQDDAKLMDSRYKESIMGDMETPCEKDFFYSKCYNPMIVGQDFYSSSVSSIDYSKCIGSFEDVAAPSCTQSQLDETYLDKLNREKIGLE